MTVREPYTEDRLAPPRPASLPHEVMALLPDHWPAELPLARVTTCGPSVSITVLHQLTPTPAYGPPDPTVMAGGYASTAHLLLAVLASRPHCAANKDWLSEALITRRSVLANTDDPDERTPLQRVENPVSVLRHLLVPPVLRTLPTLGKLRLQLVSFYRSTRESGCGYRLAGMPLIWVDVLAIEESITRAHALEQFGSDARREWEAAYTLLMQGEFAEHAPYSDWALWRRQEQERQRWECVQALQGYYRKQGEPGEREATRILQRYWQNHMSNEDAFRPLVELLGKQESFGQAEEAYTHLTQALEEEGRDLDRRTQEVMVWLRALQIQRTPSQEQSIAPEKEPENVSLPLSQAMKQGILEAISGLGDQQLTSLHGMLGKGNMDKTRRLFLEMISTYGASFIGLSQNTNVSINDVLQNWGYTTLFEQQLASLWDTYQTGGTLQANSALKMVLATYEKSDFQKSASETLCMSYQLQGSIYRDMMKYDDAHLFYEKAFDVAKELDDVELMAAALARKGVTCIQQESGGGAVPYLNHAYTLIKDRSLPCLSGYILQALSEAYALVQQANESERYIDTAQQVLDARGKYLERNYCQANTTAVAAQRGVNAVHLHNDRSAITLLDQGMAKYNPTFVRGQARLKAQQAKAYYGLGDIDACCQRATESWILARSASSNKTFARLRKLHLELVTSPWKRNEQVVDLNWVMTTL